MQENKAPLLLAHYKASHSFEETLNSIETFVAKQDGSNLNICLATPFSFIEPLIQHFADKKVTVGAEHLLSVAEGSFTASIAGSMLTEAGAQFVLIGSNDERRDSSFQIAALKSKLQRALSAGLRPILCIGETEEEFHNDASHTVLTKQLTESLADMPPEELAKLSLLYDAAWINRIPWEASNPALQKAYKTFNDILAATFTPEVLPHIKVMYAVPTYSSELPQVIAALPAAGYSLGELNAAGQLNIASLPPVVYQPVPAATIPSPTVSRTPPIERPTAKEEPPAMTLEEGLPPESAISEDPMLPADELPAPPKKVRRSRKKTAAPTPEDAPVETETAKEVLPADKLPAPPKKVRRSRKKTDAPTTEDAPAETETGQELDKNP